MHRIAAGSCQTFHQQALGPHDTGLGVGIAVEVGVDPDTDADTDPEEEKGYRPS